VAGATGRSAVRGVGRGGGAPRVSGPRRWGGGGPSASGGEPPVAVALVATSMAATAGMVAAAFVRPGAATAAGRRGRGTGWSARRGCDLGAEVGTSDARAPQFSTWRGSGRSDAGGWCRFFLPAARPALWWRRPASCIVRVAKCDSPLANAVSWVVQADDGAAPARGGARQGAPCACSRWPPRRRCRAAPRDETLRASSHGSPFLTESAYAKTPWPGVVL